MHQPEPEHDERERVSKTQRKREAESLRDLGAELAELSREQLGRLALPEPLHEALLAALSIDAHGARRRQLKYIGGLLSRLDAEPIREALARLQSSSRHAVQELHRTEQWRDRLLTEGDAALALLLAQYPHADSQELRQLVRNARREQAAAKPPKSARLLFRVLKTLVAGSAEPAPEPEPPEAD